MPSSPTPLRQVQHTALPRGEGRLLAVRPVHAGEAGAGRGESVGDETCPCGGGWARVERGESAGGETCPCGGGRAWGERSLLA